MLDREWNSERSSRWARINRAVAGSTLSGVAGSELESYMKTWALLEALAIVMDAAASNHDDLDILMLVDCCAYWRSEVVIGVSQSSSAKMNSLSWHVGLAIDLTYLTRSERDDINQAPNLPKQTTLNTSTSRLFGCNICVSSNNQFICSSHKYHRNTPSGPPHQLHNQCSPEPP